MDGVAKLPQHNNTDGKDMTLTPIFLVNKCRSIRNPT